jgi:hypothetical protein
MGAFLEGLPRRRLIPATKGVRTARLGIRRKAPEAWPEQSGMGRSGWLVGNPYLIALRQSLPGLKPTHLIAGDAI